MNLTLKWLTDNQACDPAVKEFRAQRLRDSRKILSILRAGDSTHRGYYTWLLGHIPNPADWDAGADVNAQDNYGQTVLMWAVWGGSDECLRHLIAAGADVNAQDNDGRTALMFAAWDGKVKCAKILRDG